MTALSGVTPKLAAAAALAAALTLTACENENDSRRLGQVLGAIGGAVIGSQIGSGAGRVAATVGLAALGGWLGGELAADLSRKDRQMASRAANDALEHNPPGRATAWRNDESGSSGVVTPGPAYVAPRSAGRAAGKTCREIDVVVTPGGKPTKTGKRTACRNDNGEWEVLDA